MSEHNQYVIGVDAGTTGCRTIIFDLHGTEIATAYHENPLLYPNPGWVEVPAEAMINNCLDSTRDAIAKSGIDPADVLAVAFTQMRSCFVMRDAQGGFVRNIITWQDLRGAELLPWMEQRLAANGLTEADLYDATGFPLGAVWPSSKIYWVKKHHPDQYERTTTIHTVHGLIIEAYGADSPVDDRDDLGWYQVYNADTFQLDTKWTDVFEVDPDKYGAALPAGTVVGAVSEPVAQRTGLRAGTPLVVGSGDQQCSAIGLGNMGEGMASLSLGTAGVVIGQSSEPIRDPNRKAHVLGSPLGTWGIEGHASAAASSFKWVRETFGHLERATEGLTGLDVYDLMTRQAEKSVPGATGLIYIPWLAGAAMPFYDTNARGAFIGMTFKHTKGDMLRAAMEGVCYEMRAMIAGLEQTRLPEFEFLRISGGAARSSLWNQISADIYGKPVETVKVPEATALGAAMIAAVGAGAYKDVPEAISQMVHVDKRWEPIPANVAVYDEMYEVFTDTFAALRQQVYPKLASIQAR